jgi:hypothetical protein
MERNTVHNYQEQTSWCFFLCCVYSFIMRRIHLIFRTINCFWWYFPGVAETTSEQVTIAIGPTRMRDRAEVKHQITKSTSVADADEYVCVARNRALVRL